MDLGPWNIKGSLLVLKPWTPEVTFDEVELSTCPFWVQVHGLPLQNMTARNAISIGKSHGNLLHHELAHILDDHVESIHRGRASRIRAHATRGAIARSSRGRQGH